MIQSQENPYGNISMREQEKQPSPPSKPWVRRIVLSALAVVGLGALAKHNQDDAAYRESIATPIVSTQGPEIKASPIPPAVTLDATGNSRESRVDFNSPNVTSTEVPPTTE